MYRDEKEKIVQDAGAERMTDDLVNCSVPPQKGSSTAPQRCMYIYVYNILHIVLPFIEEQFPHCASVHSIA